MPVSKGVSTLFLLITPGAITSIGRVRVVFISPKPSIGWPNELTHVRDRDFILMKKLDRQENTLFEFYNAKLIGYNCYGPFVINGPETDYVVAKYDTDKEKYWGYGKTLEDARAYLGLKLYDEYKEVINAIACKNKKKDEQGL